MNIEAIKNHLRVSDRIASSGQPEEAQFKYIAAAGFEVVVNLAMPNSENAIPEEGNIVTAHKMTYVHIPVPFDAPNAEHLQQFFAVMNAFAQRKIWVHCVLNYRVSAFLYQYQRLVHGEAPEQARKVMLTCWQPNETWQRFMAITKEELAENS
jgi:protein tyrosine phosphatase (PTP) superfamily phosphohydrolase (DUF442 family)